MLFSTSPFKAFSRSSAKGVFGIPLDDDEDAPPLFFLLDDNDNDLLIDNDGKYMTDHM